MINRSVLANLSKNFSIFTQVIVAVFISLLFGLGVYLVFEENLQLGELMALIQVGGSIIPAVAGLVVANIQFQEAKVESTPRSIKMRKTPSIFDFKGIFHTKKGLFGVDSKLHLTGCMRLLD